jgi:ribosomal subunit interface protein
MQRPLKITSRDFDLTPAIEADLRDRVAALERYWDRITGCEVTLEAPVRHHRKGGPFVVHIRLTVPGGELEVNRRSGEDFQVAIRDAFDAARRQVEDHLRELRRDVKSHEAPDQGRIAKIFPTEGYGFIETPDAREVYFHRNSVMNADFDRIAVGATVRFVEEIGEKGPQASTVAIVSPHRRTSRAHSDV